VESGLDRPVTTPAVNIPSDDRSAMAVALGWTSRVITISLEMVAPGLFGVWLDRKLGTKVVFTIVGFALGFTLAMVHLLRISKQPPDDRKEN